MILGCGKIDSQLCNACQPVAISNMDRGTASEVFKSSRLEMFSIFSAYIIERVPNISSQGSVCSTLMTLLWNRAGLVKSR